jgi:hypothetical protein
LAWLTIGEVLQFAGQVGRALEAFGTAETEFRLLDDACGQRVASKGSALLLESRQEDEAALPFLVRAAHFALEDSDLDEAARLNLRLGELLVRLGRRPEAASALSGAAEMFRTLGHGQLEGRARAGLLAIVGIDDRSEGQSQLFRMTELLAQHFAGEGDPQSEGVAHLMLARLAEEMESAAGDADG